MWRQLICILILALFVGQMWLPVVKGEETIVLDKPDGSKITIMQMGLSEGPCDIYWLEGNTNSWGDFYLDITEHWPYYYYFGRIICSCVHMDWMHHVNSCVEDGGKKIHVRSWNMFQQIGPVWFTCIFHVCH